MNHNRTRAQFWFGACMTVLLVLAACARRGEAAVQETVAADPTPTVPVTLAAVTVRPTPSPTPTTQEPLLPVQVLPSSLAWDPSGRWLAYASTDGRIWLRDPASEVAQQVEGIGGFEQADLKVTWSPSGNELLVYGEWGLDYPRWTGLWLLSITGAGITPARPIVAQVRGQSPVEQNSGTITSAAWSPDGKHVAYTFQAEAWTYELGSGESRQVTVLSEQPLAREGATEPFDGVREVAWAPDGGSLALGLSCNCPSPWSGVGIVDAPAGQASASRETRLLVDGGQSVSWSPDGRWIAFQNAAGDWTGGSTFDFYGIEPASGEIVNLTLSNPDWDPLFPTEGAYKDAPYQTARLRWGPEGRFLFETLDYLTPSEAAPQWGFAVKDEPEGVVETHLGTVQTWYLFPAWLADGRTAYLEADGAASIGDVLHVQRAVVGLQAISLEQANVRGVAWSPDGTAIALCLSDTPESLPDAVTIVPLPLPPVVETKATPAVEPTPTAEAELASDGWKIYRNETLGYRFDYPADASVTSEDDPLKTVTITGPLVGDEYWPIIFVNHPGDREDYHPPQGADLAQWLTDHNLLPDERQPDTQIAGTTALHTRFSRSQQSYAFDSYYFARSGQLYTIVILHTGDKEDWTLYHRFLESFRFDSQK